MASVLSVLSKIAGGLRSVGIWVSNKPNRLRMRGARVEIIALVLTRNPEPSVLLGQSAYGQTWMPPQEGVNYEEPLEDALERCLRIECGLDLPNDAIERERLIHLRSISYAGLLDLPRERWGERPIAGNITGTPLESIVLRRKAYWRATMLVKSRDAIRPQPDGRELVKLEWFNLEDARRVLASTNRPEKTELLLESLDRCAGDLYGRALKPS